MNERLSMRVAYGNALVDLGRRNQRVVVLSADVANSDHSYMFGEKYPDRFFNVGIAEQALVDIAAGMAMSGLIPFANTFAFLFATRALEMIRTHLCYGGANVKLMAAYAGLSDSFDGPTHQSISDIGIMRSLPGMTIVNPADTVEVAKLLPQVADWDGPVYFRLCRNELPKIYSDDDSPKIGEAVTLVEGTAAAIIATGVMVERSMRAAATLQNEGIGVEVIDMHTIKPLDRKAILRAASKTGAIVTAEEHSVIGGLGSAVAEVLGEEAPTPLVRVGVGDRFTETGPYDTLLDNYGMSVDDVASAVRTVLKRKRG